MKNNNKDYRGYVIMATLILLELVAFVVLLFTILNNQLTEIGVIMLFLSVLLLFIGGVFLKKSVVLWRNKVNNDLKKHQFASEFMFDLLLKKQMAPSKDANTIVFHSRGGHFRAHSLDQNIIRISFPSIYATDVARQNKLARCLNVINASNPVIKSVFVKDSIKNNLVVHSFADIYYTSKNCDTNIIESLVDGFLALQKDLVMGMNVLEMEFDNNSAGSSLSLSLN